MHKRPIILRSLLMVATPYRLEMVPRSRYSPAFVSHDLYVCPCSVNGFDMTHSCVTFDMTHSQRLEILLRSRRSPSYADGASNLSLRPPMEAGSEKMKADSKHVFVLSFPGDVTASQVLLYHHSNIHIYICTFVYIYAYIYTHTCIFPRK